MKIGIVSMYGWLKLWDNYGTLLQNYALQTYLRKQGHETYWIRTRSEGQQQRSDQRNVYSIIKFSVHMAKHLIRQILGKDKGGMMENFNRKHPRQFGAFFERYIPHTSSEYTLEELLQSPPDADAYIVGSDQIWRDVTPTNFLGFGASHVRRIAYGVSAPWPSLSDDWISQARVAIDTFQAVSVREIEGLDVCSCLGRDDAFHVVDPTLLLTKNDYLKLIQEEEHEESLSGSFVLGYFVNLKKLNQIPWAGLREFAIKETADLQIVPLQGSELVVPLDYVYTPSPIGWIDAFDKARYVVTNSYHGVLFAIIMHTPFIVILQTGGTASENCRFTSVLRPLGLEDRIFSESEWRKTSAVDIERWMKSTIDWDDVEFRLRGLRQVSIEFLLNSLA